MIAAHSIAGSARASQASGPIDKIDAFIAAEMTRQRVPGGAVAVIRKGEVVLAKGYGLANVEHGVPVTPETIFQTGSVGKQFTAVALMLLVEDGAVALDESIAKFFPDAPPSWRPITVRHLLTHTSGIPNFGEGFDLQKNYTADELAKHAYGVKLEFAPGARWSYSNTGYVLLGIIIDRQSRKSYQEVLRNRVFGPLGMKTARGISEHDIVPHRAAGYELEGEELKNQEWVSPTMNSTADGSLYVSLLDMVAWEKGLRTKRVLTMSDWATVFTPVTLNSGKTYPYGFGWVVDEERGQLRQHHGGAWQGFKTYVSRYLGDDLTVIVLTNLAQADPEAFVSGVAAIFNPSLAAPVTPIPDKDPTVTKRVRRLLAQSREGTLSPEEFAHVPVGYFPAHPNHYRKLLADAGDIVQLEIVEARERNDDRFFRYHARFHHRGIAVWLGVAPDDKISTFSLKEINRDP